MASFTDKISQFNPYIQQLPAQEMQQVGMYKQQQYDQGVQKIQGYIDNIAGMDVIRNADKQYLQSKLNDLGGKLRTVAAGDFSNHQLVNSVGGMATSIVKDPTIQNAVASTARVRQGISDKTAANKSDKGAVENDWFFDNGVNSYLNSTDPNASYSGGYLNYVDLKPKFTEVLKSLHESGSTEDIPWSTNKDGSVNYGETAKSMVEKGWKGVTSSKIENALRASLSQNDLRQLQISGMYQFRNETPETLIAQAKNQYDVGIRSVENKIDGLKKYAELNKGNDNIVAQSNEAIAELEKQIKDDGAYRSQLKVELEGSILAINKNPDAVKADLYKNGFIKQFANAHSWEETVLKYMNNPILEADHWTATFGLQQKQFGEEVRHHLVDESHGASMAQIAWYNAHKDDAKAPFVAIGGNPTDISVSEVVDAQLNKYKTAADSGVKTLAEQLSKKAGVPVSVSDVEKMIDGSYKGNVKPGPEYKSSINDIVENRRQAGFHASAIKAADNELLNDKEATAAKKQIDDVLATHKSLTIKDGAGRDITYTPKEIMDYVLHFKREQSGSFQGVGKPLTNKEKLLDDVKGVGSIWSDYKDVLKLNTKVGGIVRERYDKILGDKIPIYAPKTTAFDTSKPAEKEYFENMASVLTDADTADRGGYDNWNSSTVKGWLSNPTIKNALIFKTYDNGVLKQLWVTGPNGETQKRTLTASDINQIPSVQTSSDVQIKNNMIMGGGITNPTINGDAQGAQWKQSDFPNVKKIRVVADAISDLKNNNVIFPKFQVHTTDGWKVIQIDKAMDIPSAQQFIRSLNDGQVKDLVKHYLPAYVNKLD